MVIMHMGNFIVIITFFLTWFWEMK